MDKENLAKLILENEAQLYRIAKSILKSDQDCADAAQEAIARAFEKLHTLRCDAYGKTWLIRILINECYRILRKREREIFTREEWAYSSLKQEDFSSLYLALLKLKAEFRVVLVLHYLEGFSVEEIARMLESSEGTVKSRLYRGREKMRALLSEEDL